MGASYQINGTSVYIPQILTKKKLNKIIISGMSRMPDPDSFYSDLATHLNESFKEFNNTLFVEFYLEYINSTSTKWLYFITQELEFLQKEGGTVEIFWKYEQDDEAIELIGDVLKSQSNIPFQLIPIEN